MNYFFVFSRKKIGKSSKLWQFAIAKKKAYLGSLLLLQVSPRFLFFFNFWWSYRKMTVLCFISINYQNIKNKNSKTNMK